MNKDFAVLYRTNAQSRSMEEALRRLNIPYRIYGGISFYQRKEIKDILAYYRLTINHNDDTSLTRIINYPLRGIGQATVDKISVAAAEHGISMFTVCENLKDFNLGINGGIAGKIGEFVTKIKSYSLQLGSKDAYDLGNHIAVNCGLVKELYADKTPEGVSRYENIQELLNGLKDFVEQERTPQESELNDLIKQSLAIEGDTLFGENKEMRTLDEFMQEITLMTDRDTEDEDEREADKVTMMTIHAAKGLEFKNVYIVGLEENLFPSQLALNSRTELEEERRLFYVAVTRAEKHCFLSYANTRYRFGNLIYCEASRFIEEIDEKYLEYEVVSGTKHFDDNVFEKMRNSFYDLPSKELPTKSSAFKEVKKGIGFTPQKKLISVNTRLGNVNTGKPIDLTLNKDLKPGDVILHEKFGRGVIQGIEGNWPETKAIIQFDKFGQKSLLLKYAKLQRG
jgi:DNA helicase-2/ATP-dependent DNA helicase PcrA